MFDMLVYRIKRPFHLLRTGLLEGVPAYLQSRTALKNLRIVGITGTDGKTTTSTLLYHLLTTADIKAGLISTVGGYVGADVLDTGLHVTSPGPRDLYRLLRLMHKAGCSTVVLEATSHGLYQHRFWGIRPESAGVTNVTHEHLDYHQTWYEYASAKLLLLKHATRVFLNATDESKTFFHQHKWSKNQIVQYYGPDTKLPKAVLKAIQARFPEAYNRSNATLAFLMAQQLGVSDEQAVKGIETFVGVPGRMQVVAEKPIKVIVDFAHTPNALEKVLTAVRATLPAGARLIAVFGCAGLRDVQKRPMMGEIGARLADTAIFTSEDPRTEDIWAIFRQMKAGVTNNHNRIRTIPDRRAAITFAIRSAARRGDIVVVCGKGHEQSMCFGTTETPWHDPTVVTEILQGKA